MIYERFGKWWDAFRSSICWPSTSLHSSPSLL
jgi:hypothetical protein